MATLKAKNTYWLMATCLLLVGSIVYTAAQTQSPAAARPTSKQALSWVGVTRVKSDTITTQVEAYGEVKPKEDLTLSSDVAGKVLEVSEHFEVGSRIKAGTVLAKIEDTAYRAQLATAERQLAEANEYLLEQQRAQAQARVDRKVKGQTQQALSPLALYEPQIATARAKVEEARALVAQAKLALSYTQITAPFDAVVVEKYISPGTQLTASGQVARLYSSDTAEVRFSLTTADWQSLSLNALQLNGDAEVQLYDMDTEARWQGYLYRAAEHIDTQTRQRSLTVRVDKPLAQSTPLLAGNFVRVSFKGKAYPKHWRIPESALTNNNTLWYLDDSHQLHQLRVNPGHAKDGYQIIPAAFEQATIVLRPTSQFSEGDQVKPRWEDA